MLALPLPMPPGSGDAASNSAKAPMLRAASREAAKRRGYLVHHQERKAAQANKEAHEAELIQCWPHGLPVRSLICCCRWDGTVCGWAGGWTGGWLGGWVFVVTP
jgi:hypothetical protein